jgi:predicted transcriptional regulator
LNIVVRVDSPLDKKLAAFLKKKRGEMTYKAFSQRTGLPPSTLFRLEQGGQSITLGKLHLVMTRLKCQFPDIFDD